MKAIASWLASIGFLVAGLPVFSQQHQLLDTFSETTCGISFRHPKSWIVVHDPPGVWSADYSGELVMCTFGLRPATWSSERRSDTTGLIREFPVQIAVVGRPFLEVADRAGFAHSDLKAGDWMIAIRQGYAPAEQFRTSCCQAVIGETWGNTVAADGSKATYTSTIAVVNDRRRHSAIIEGQSAHRFGAIVQEIATSIRFSRWINGSMKR